MASPSTTAVFATRIPLLLLDRHRATVDRTLVDEAAKELLAGASPGPDGFRAGYLLGVEAAEDRPTPRARALVEELRRAIVTAVGVRHGVDFSFSFMKVGVGQAPSADEGVHYEGHHLDTHPGLDAGVELLRVLVNLSTEPRTFVYAQTDRWQLEARGITLRRQEFEQLRLPPDIESQSLEIPGRRPGAVYALRFLASAVPHVGLNGPHGYFLASFEALAQREVLSETAVSALS
jgi:hypothetical protein